MDEPGESTAAHETGESTAAHETKPGDDSLDAEDELDPVAMLKGWLDEVPCQPRLYPARLYALQLLSGERIDALIDATFIQPLGAIVPPPTNLLDALRPPPETPPYRFTPELLACRPHQFPFPLYANQFASDLTVFGLREAILFLPSYPQAAQIARALDGAVLLYHHLARAYLDHRGALARSDHGRIRLLLASVDEGAPQQVRGWRAEQGDSIGPRRTPPRDRRRLWAERGGSAAAAAHRGTDRVSRRLLYVRALPRPRGRHAGGGPVDARVWRRSARRGGPIRPGHRRRARGW